MWFIVWIILMALVTIYGGKKGIGTSTFFISLFLSPLIGLIYAALHEKPNHAYRKYYDKAKREDFKGNYLVAIDNYKDALYHLHHDYEGLKGKNNRSRDNLISTIEKKVKLLEEKI